MQIESDRCPGYQWAVDIIGRRWAGAVVRAMLLGASRFSDIRAAIPGITDRVLSQRLKDLEADGIITRQVLEERPVRVEYTLTEQGKSLAGVVDAIASWADEWFPAGEQVRPAN